MATSDVVITPYQLGDVEALYEAVDGSRAQLGPWMPWCHADYSIDDSRSWVTSQVAAFEAGTEFQFVVRSRNGRFLGGCGLNGLDRTNRRANLGYWIRSDAAGRGVATAAVVLLVRWTYRTTDFDRVEIISSIENFASQRVAEKAGAVREGILRRRLVLYDRAHDAVVYSFLRAEKASETHTPLTTTDLESR